MILTPPVFIAEGHDVMVFRDAAAAELWLEEIDLDRAPGWTARLPDRNSRDSRRQASGDLSLPDAVASFVAWAGYPS